MGWNICKWLWIMFCSIENGNENVGVFFLGVRKERERETNRTIKIFNKYGERETIA